VFSVFGFVLVLVQIKQPHAWKTAITDYIDYVITFSHRVSVGVWQWHCRLPVTDRVSDTRNATVIDNCAWTLCIGLSKTLLILTLRHVKNTASEW